jgi:hypothetical protein
MLNLTDERAVRSLRAFLREVGYGPATRAFVSANDDVLFPSFRDLQTLLKAASPFHRLLLSVLRQGHTASEARLLQAIGRENLDLLLGLNLLVPDERGEYHTPSLALVDTAGLTLVVSLPAHYPTSTVRQQPVGLTPEANFLARSLPPSLQGKDVLDACSGAGLQSLICASRGARRVVGLDRSPLAVNFARFNALLNGFDKAVDFRQSDLLSALDPSERFDYAVSLSPFLPSSDGLETTAPAADDTAVLLPLLEQLPRHLAQEAAGLIYCQAPGDQHRIFLHDRCKTGLKAAGVQVNAIVLAKLPLRIFAGRLVETVQQATFDATREVRVRTIETWRAQLAEVGVEFVYSELLDFRRADGEADFVQVPVYDAKITDPLVAAVRMNRMAV